MVLAIVGVLTALAAPSFTSTTRKFRALGEANALAGDLQFARSEALKQGAPITICASASPAGPTATCSGANTWHTGWIVYSVNAAGTQTVLKIQKAFSATDTLLTDSGASSLTYSGDGFATGLPDTGSILFTVDSTPPDPNAKQCVLINKAGRQKTLTAGKESCV